MGWRSCFLKRTVHPERALLGFSAASSLSLNGATGLWAVRTSVNPANQPVSLGKNFASGQGSGGRSEGLEKVSSSFYIKILSSKRTLLFLSPVSVADSQTDSETLSWLHHMSPLPASNNLASPADRDSNNSRW